MLRRLHRLWKWVTNKRKRIITFFGTAPGFDRQEFGRLDDIEIKCFLLRDLRLKQHGHQGQPIDMACGIGGPSGHMLLH